MIWILPILKINTLQEITCLALAIYVSIGKITTIQRPILLKLIVKTGLILSMSFDTRVTSKFGEACIHLILLKRAVGNINLTIGQAKKMLSAQLLGCQCPIVSISVQVNCPLCSYKIIPPIFYSSYLPL